MTDEQMDARLRAAGERWRAATAVAEADEPASFDDLAPRRTQHRRRWPLIASAAVIAAALVLGGTLLLRNGADTPQPSGDVAGLQGHVWLLTGVPGARSSAVLYIDRDGKVVADDECRLIDAHARVHGSTLTVTGAVTRYKSCTDQYPPAFFHGAQAFLTGTSRFRITSQALIITKDGHVDRFVPAPQGTPVPTADYPTLTGVQWELTDIRDASGRSVRVAPGQTLRLDPGTIRGSIGCTKFGTTASVSGDRVAIGGYFAPLACLRNPVAAVLRGTVQVSVVRAQLTVSKGRAQLVYRWVPASTAGHDPAQLENRAWSVITGGELQVGATVRFRAGVVIIEYAGCSVTTLTDVAPGVLRSVRNEGGVQRCAQPRALTGDTWRVWSIENGRLFIFDAAQAYPLVLAPVTATAAASPLEGTWNFVIPGASMAVFEQFTVAGNAITITHRCYVNRATVAVTDTALEVAGVHLFRAVPCPQRPSSVAGSERISDARLDHLLAGTATWTIKNRVLTVSAHGVASMTFERASGP